MVVLMLFYASIVSTLRSVADTYDTYIPKRRKGFFSNSGGIKI